MVAAIDVYKAVLEQLKHEFTTSITPTEFNEIIWTAQLEYVNNRYWAHDQHQKSVDDLAVLIVETDGIIGPSPLLNIGNSIAGGEVFLVPAAYYHMLNVAAIVKYKNVPCKTDDTLSDPIVAIPVTDDEEKVLRHHYYKRPLAQYPRLRYKRRGNIDNSGNSYLRFLAGDSIVEKVIITYLREPKRIVFDPNGQSVDSEFSEYVTKEIVKWATAAYLEIIQDPRWQSYKVTLNSNFLQYPPNMQEGT